MLLTADSTFETLDEWQEKKIADLRLDDPRLPVICTITPSFVDQDQLALSANTPHASGKQSRHHPSPDLESLSGKLEALMSEMSSLRQKIDAHEQEIKGLKSKNEDLMSENEDLKLAIQSLEDRINSVEDVQYSMLLQDHEAIKHIKARHLLMVVQPHFAQILGSKTDNHLIS